MADDKDMGVAWLRPLGGSQAMDVLRERGSMPYGELEALVRSMCKGSGHRARRTLGILEARGAFSRDGDMAVDRISGMYASALAAVGGRSLGARDVADAIGVREGMALSILEDLESRGDVVGMRRGNGRHLWRAAAPGEEDAAGRRETPTEACSDDIEAMLSERSMTYIEVAEATGLPRHVAKGVLTNMKAQGRASCMTSRSGRGAQWFVGSAAEADALRKVSEERGIEPPVRVPSSTAPAVDGRNRDYLTYPALSALVLEALEAGGPMDEKGIMAAVGRTKPIGKMLQRMRGDGLIEPVPAGGAWLWQATARRGRSTPLLRSSGSSSTSRATRAPRSWGRTRWRTAAGAGPSCRRWSGATARRPCGPGARSRRRRSWRPAYAGSR